MHSPRARYEADLSRPGFLQDPAQAMAVARLDALHGQLAPLSRSGLAPATEANPGRAHWLSRWLGGARGSAPSPALPGARGLYLWGGVGRGKTYLMDCFHDSLPGSHRLRLHFHRFMREVHRDRRALGEVQRPLERIADGIARRAAVLCLDEFHVSDITDAMILAGLLEALFARGVVLVTTSNEEPVNLYRGGLQRERFLPAIDLLRAHCEVLNVDGGCDYRLRALERAPLWVHPLGADADGALARLFAEVAGAAGEEGGAFTVDDREIPLVRAGGGAGWFTFADLCQAARGAGDYIEVARCFHTVVLARVPAFSAGMDDPVRRFITAVDEFYDRGVKLVVSAEQPLDAISVSGRLAFSFARTVSRLREMQSHEYLERPHAPD
jgi:cell division protein ZapE